MDYVIQLIDAAIRELGKLDNRTRRRIVSRLEWLAEQCDVINHEALSAELAGFLKLRVGDYRVIYQILHDERVIVVHQIGHRRQIYRKK